MVHSDGLRMPLPEQRKIGKTMSKSMVSMRSTGAIIRSQERRQFYCQFKYLAVIVTGRSTKLSKPQVFGQFRDKVQVADDFDQELPDSFWLDKDETK